MDVKRASADERRELQGRIDAALAEPPRSERPSTFSAYTLNATPPLVDPLMRAADDAGGHGAPAVEAALEEFERLDRTEDPGRTRHALRAFLIHHPAAAELGLRVTPLERRAPWKVRPSDR